MSTCADCRPVVRVLKHEEKFAVTNFANEVELCPKHSAMEERLKQAERILVIERHRLSSANMPPNRAIETYFREDGK